MSKGVLSKAPSMKDAISNLSSLPTEIRKKLDQMCSLDEEANAKREKADEITNNYILTAKRTTRSSRNSTRKDIRRMHVECCSIADKKVGLAKQLSDIVDSHIQRLDESLAEFEDGFFKNLPSSSKNVKKQDTASADKSSTKRKVTLSDLKDEIKKEKSRKTIQGDFSLLTHSILKHTVPSRQSNSAEFAAASMNLPSLQMSGPGNPLDMPVDPHEPTYCICHNVSYGEMVGCDNPDCNIEWFHFACVGITEQPDGEWFCPRCSELMVQDGASTSNQKDNKPPKKLK